MRTELPPNLRFKVTTMQGAWITSFNTYAEAYMFQRVYPHFRDVGIKIWDLKTNILVYKSRKTKRGYAKY